MPDIIAHLLDRTNMFLKIVIKILHYCEHIVKTCDISICNKMSFTFMVCIIAQDQWFCFKRLIRGMKLFLITSVEHFPSCKMQSKFRMHFVLHCEHFHLFIKYNCGTVAASLCTLSWCIIKLCIITSWLLLLISSCTEWSMWFNGK